jgi:hypothetical protein
MSTLTTHTNRTAAKLLADEEIVINKYRRNNEDKIAHNINEVTAAANPVLIAPRYQIYYVLW